VHAEAPHPERPRLLKHGIGNLLVVDKPAVIEPLGRGPRVCLPGVDLERGRLQVHEVEVGLAELGRDKAMGEHAAGLRHAVDLIADVGHLLRRHYRFLGIRPGWGRDEPDRRLAIEEDLFHKVLPREVGHGAAVGRKLRVHPLGPLAQPQQSLLRDGPLAPSLCIARVIPGANVMDLYVKDEVGLTRTLPQRRRIGGFDREDVEELAEDRVHGEQ
jgi:hypothetical protein